MTPGIDCEICFEGGRLAIEKEIETEKNSIIILGSLTRQTKKDLI